MPERRSNVNKASGQRTYGGDYEMTLSHGVINGKERVKSYGATKLGRE